MCVTERCAHVQVQLLHDGKERGRMYAGYALSSIISPNSGMTEIRAAGVIPALVAVLNTSRVRLHCSPWRLTRLAVLQSNMCLLHHHLIYSFLWHHMNAC